MNNKTYTYKYPRPALTVDMVVLKTPCNNGEILLIQRLNPPFKNHWALPGGFVDMDETLEEAANRELEEETGLVNIIMNQFKAYSAVDRDPRHRTVSVVFIGVAPDEAQATAGDDAKNARWFSLNDLPELAFDHQQIVDDAIEMVKSNMG